MTQSSLDWQKRLASKGYRVTEPRKTVMAILSASCVPLCPKSISERAQARERPISLVTVYRALELLIELGLVRRVHGAEACQGYVLASPGHHHVVVCQRCGKVSEFSGYEGLEELEAWAAKETGFEIAHHLLQFYGVCADCREREADSQRGGEANEESC